MAKKLDNNWSNHEQVKTTHFSSKIEISQYNKKKYATWCSYFVTAFCISGVNPKPASITAALAGALLASMASSLSYTSDNSDDKELSPLLDLKTKIKVIFFFFKTTSVLQEYWVGKTQPQQYILR